MGQYVALAPHPQERRANERAASSRWIASLKRYRCPRCEMISTVAGRCAFFDFDRDETCGAELRLVFTAEAA